MLTVFRPAGSAMMILQQMCLRWHLHYLVHHGPPSYRVALNVPCEIHVTGLSALLPRKQQHAVLLLP